MRGGEGDGGREGERATNGTRLSTSALEGHGQSANERTAVEYIDFDFRRRAHLTLRICPFIPLPPSTPSTLVLSSVREEAR